VSTLSRHVPIRFARIHSRNESRSIRKPSRHAPLHRKSASESLGPSQVAPRSDSGRMRVLRRCSRRARGAPARSPRGREHCGRRSGKRGARRPRQILERRVPASLGIEPRPGKPLYAARPLASIFRVNLHGEPRVPRTFTGEPRVATQRSNGIGYSISSSVCLPPSSVLSWAAQPGAGRSEP